MFTGLVEGCGRVNGIEPDGAAVCLRIEFPEQMLSESTGNSPANNGQTTIGDSVAINGCCLTVVEIDGATFVFEAGEETLSKTNLGNLQIGDLVNLERALPANGRLGGHFVQGHIDAVGQICEIQQDGEWLFIRFQLPKELTSQIVTKGSITVDGISLTVTDVDETTFRIALIPHTLNMTTFGKRSVGDSVNIETDLIGKYVQKLLSCE